MGVIVRSLIRRTLRRVLVLATVGALAVTLGPMPAQAAPVVPGPLFGQHIGSISQGTPPALPKLGAVRLWDSRVTWREVEVANNEYRWAKLDAAVRNARALGAREILYTLGSTPRWAASNPNSKLALYGPGSNTHPKSDNLYLDYLKAVAKRYKGRITSYQVWNEANLHEFYLGTPTQMAKLTKKARAALRSVDPSAKLVAASTTVRAKGPVGKFGKAYGKAMRKVGWPVDVVSGHFYPPAKDGPATRAAYIKTIKRYYRKYGAGRKPLWDTEVNFGDTRPYMKVKVRNTGAKAATYVARTYIDSMRYGVSRVFWYGWDLHQMGTDMTSRTGSGISAGGRAFLATQDWMAGRTWLGCKTKSRITTCNMRTSSGGKLSIRYASSSKALKLPAGTTAIRRLDGSRSAASAGQSITLTSQPILIVGA
ncbi:MAG: hypothetical protein WCF04_13100 [Candidatus Nanopelagicales bacterium]